MPIPLHLRLGRAILRHYPLNTPRVAILDRLPGVPEECGPFPVKHGLTIADCYGGDDYVSRSLFGLGDFDPWVGRALRRLAKPGDTGCDIGANIGAEAIALARAVGPGGRVFCFEPVPRHAAKLRVNLKANGLTNATVHELALSSAPGTIVMGVPAGQQGMARVGLEGDTVQKHEVQAVTFDQFCADNQVNNVAVCKIDVEGHETSVIAGMRRALGAGMVRSLVFERHVRQTQDDEVIGTLASHGYRIFRLFKSLRRVNALECNGTDRAPRRSAPTSDFVAIHRGAGPEVEALLWNL